MHMMLYHSGAIPLFGDDLAFENAQASGSFGSQEQKSQPAM